ncbi:MAG: hypothetical protein DDT28_00906 [Dehalococcoidia bacterium]|nr:hypothetical protein [Chloroflexota bacterium]
MYRTHYEKGREIAALWAEERTKLLTLPGVPFEVVRLLTATVDKYCRVRFENHPYDVPRARPGQQVLLEVHWDQVATDVPARICENHRTRYEIALSILTKSIM